MNEFHTFLYPDRVFRVWRTRFRGQFARIVDPWACELRSLRPSVPPPEGKVREKGHIV